MCVRNTSVSSARDKRSETDFFIFPTSIKFIMQQRSPDSQRKASKTAYNFNNINIHTGFNEAKTYSEYSVFDLVL